MITNPKKWKRKIQNALDADPGPMSQESLRLLGCRPWIDAAIGTQAASSIIFLFCNYQIDL